MKRRKITRPKSHFSLIESIAHRAGCATTLSRGHNAHVVLLVRRQGSPCVFQIEQPVEEKPAKKAAAKKAPAKKAAAKKKPAAKKKSAAKKRAAPKQPAAPKEPAAVASPGADEP